MMIKIVSPSGWDFDTPIASLIKVSSHGLVGHDRHEFIKRAGASSNVFLPYLDSIKVAADEEPVHLIALGAYEAYGPNRNGDGFKEAACKRYHDTFVKFARAYRNHKNRDPQLSYGLVKLSAYNPAMRRVELLLSLNKDKVAAERNSGLVADRELEKLARNEDLAWSMACKVSHDICSYCGNQARTRDEYCTSEKCAAGGCKDNLTRLIKLGNDVHHLHVDNPHPLWFDISQIFRPADRIAWGSKAGYLTKAAEEHGFFAPSGAKAAEDLGLSAPLPVLLYDHAVLPGEWDFRRRAQIMLVHGLSALEKSSASLTHPEVRRAFTADVQPGSELTDPEGGEPGSIKFAAWLGALADCKIVMPLRDFARLTKRASLIDHAALRLRGAFTRLAGDVNLEQKLGANRFAPAEKLASAKQRQRAGKLASVFSLDQESVSVRCQLGVIRGHTLPASVLEKQAATETDPLVEQLAADYVLYKVAALERIAASDRNFPLTARLALVQNEIN